MTRLWNNKRVKIKLHRRPTKASPWFKKQHVLSLYCVCFTFFHGIKLGGKASQVDRRRVARL